jgi:hypothetical protein
MSEAQLGGCECGDIRYEFCCEPLTCYTCHCADCQTRSGSAFTTAVAIPSDQLVITRGEVGTYNFGKGDMKLCMRCGTHLWGVADVLPTCSMVRLGTIDDSRWVAPVAHIWADNALPWVELGETMARFPGQPEDPIMLLEEWNKVHGN